MDTGDDDRITPDGSTNPVTREEMGDFNWTAGRNPEQLRRFRAMPEEPFEKGRRLSSETERATPAEFRSSFSPTPATKTSFRIFKDRCDICMSSVVLGNRAGVIRI